METKDTTDRRLFRSAQLLRGWRWMSLVSTQRDDAISILSQEAKFLVQMGPKHPEHAQKIGRLIVAYQRLITSMKQQAVAQQLANAGTDLPSLH